MEIQSNPRVELERHSAVPAPYWVEILAQEIQGPFQSQILTLASGTFADANSASCSLKGYLSLLYLLILRKAELPLVQHVHGAQDILFDSHGLVFLVAAVCNFPVPRGICVRTEQAANLFLLGHETDNR
jgi:hypothetical protein